MDYFADGRPYALTYDGDVYYYIINLQGDVIGLYDEDGNVVVTYDYDVWGYPYVSGTLANSVGYFNPFRFKCYLFDDDAQLYYLQSRFYDPYIGRFISADAYLVAGDHINSTNMYAYCLNNPVMYWDCDGTAAEPIHYSVPLYQQGTYRLCWAVCQIMVLDYYSGDKNFSIKEAKELSLEICGVEEGVGIPLNIKLIPTPYFLLTPEKLYEILENGPAYAYYLGDHGSHVVVITGIDLEKDIVYTNNPQYNKEGEQSFSEFMNGVYYPPGSSDSYKLRLVFQATDTVNPIVEFIASQVFTFVNNL